MSLASIHWLICLMHGGMESRRMLTCMMANMLIAH